MSTIITGVSTDTEFLGAINDKGASLTANATPEALASALDSTGQNVSYDSTNEWIVEQINTPVAPTVYTITYDVNGGTGTVEAEEVTAGESVTLDDGSGLTAPEGKEFDGWSTTKNDSSTKVASLTPEADTTVYALWKDAEQVQETPGE